MRLCFVVSMWGFVWGGRKTLREEMIERKGQWTGCPFFLKSDTGDCRERPKENGEKERSSGRKREGLRLEVKM